MISIIKGGCNYRHPSSFIMSRPNGLDHYVLLLIKSESTFHILDKELTLPANRAIIIAPGTAYRYHNPASEYVNDWLHFDVDDQSAFHALFPITNTMIPLADMDVCSNLLQQLFWENSYTEEHYRQENIDALFHVLLNHLRHNDANRCNVHLLSPYHATLCNIRLDMRNSLSDNHSIKRYAELLHISESYFQHLYSEQFGISFQKDLIHARIDYAKTMLHSSDATMSQIATMCGYHNEVHFYRQFKEITCITPAQYKKQNR